MLTIRAECPEDEQAVYHLIQTAFATAEHSDGTEQDLVNRLRHSRAFVPALSLVAEKDGQIVGHILFTEASLGTETVLALAPLAVLPAQQKKGIGKALIQTGHRRARNLGYPLSVVLGSTQYYPKFGYVPASTYGISAPFPVPAEHFMAYSLCKTPFQSTGILQYAKEFFD